MKIINWFFSIFLCLYLAACNSNDKPEEEPVIEEPCPDLDEVNSHFAYGDLPDLSARLAYMGMDRPLDSYNYPLYLGMDGWMAATDSGRNPMKVCQVIPECLLRKMTTQAVIQAIWELPNLWRFFTIYEPYLQRVIEFQRSFYNAYEELYNRKDAGTALLERLTLVDPLTPYVQYEAQHLELLLSRTDFLSQLNESKKRKTVEIALSNYEKRYTAWWEDGLGLGSFSRPTAWILMGKAMYVAGYVPFLEAMNENEELKYFIEGWRPNRSDPSKKDDYLYLEYYYGNITLLIIEYAKNYIND